MHNDMVRTQLASYLFRCGASLTGRPMRELANIKSATLDVDAAYSQAARRTPGNCPVAAVAVQATTLAPYVGDIELVGHTGHVDEVYERLVKMRGKTKGRFSIHRTPHRGAPCGSGSQCVVSTDPELLAYGVSTVVTRVCPVSLTYSAWSQKAALRGMRLSLQQLQEVCALASHGGRLEGHLQTARVLNGVSRRSSSVIAAVAERDGGDLTDVWKTYEQYRGWIPSPRGWIPSPRR
jgi:hypothetical protein